MNMKAAASLTGSLLARKGAAYPAAYSAPSTAPSAAPTEDDGDSQQPQRAYNDPRVIASAPPQNPDPLMTRLGLATRGPISEDCLRLNVWAPALGRGERPVLVWLHGGAFFHGATDTPVYDGQHLARRGDAVVVTLGYRVGALGFLYLRGTALRDMLEVRKE